MPQLGNKKITLGQLQKLSIEERAKVIEPIVKANSEQFSRLANTLAEAANFTKTISSIASSFKFPAYDILQSIKFPELPDMSSYIKPTAFPIGRYDPPVKISKSKWEIEKEEREAYLNELHIQILEQQLNLVKGAQSPQYDINTGIITFMGKAIEIPLNTNLEMVCRIVLKNMTNMKRKWSWDEIVEENRETTENFTSRQIYTAARSVNEKVAQETAIKDFLLTNPTSTVQLNPKFLAK